MRNYLKNYKVKNPRALKLGLMTTGLSLMQGAGQTYDRPVSTTGLVGAAGLQGLGTYEATRAADIASKEKGVAEAAKERRHIETIKAGKSISETEIGARESLAKADIAAKKSLADFEQDWRKRESQWRYGESGIEEQKIGKGLTPSAQLSQRKLETYDVHKRNEANEKVLDLLAGRTVEELGGNERIALESLVAGSGFEIKSEEIPAKRSGLFDFGKPNIPATTREYLAPREPSVQGGLMQQRTEGQQTTKPIRQGMYNGKPVYNIDGINYFDPEGKVRATKGALADSSKTKKPATLDKKQGGASGTWAEQGFSMVKHKPLINTKDMAKKVIQASGGIDKIHDVTKAVESATLRFGWKLAKNAKDTIAEAIKVALESQREARKETFK